MQQTDFAQLIAQALEIRDRYHRLELQHHGSKWSIEEDALAFLTDAGLVGRLAMAQQGRWPTLDNGNLELKHKLSECIWWIIVLAQRMDINIEQELSKWLEQKLQDLPTSTSSTL